MRKGARLGRIAEFVEVPPEALLNVSRVEIVGCLQVRVENHRGVEQFRPSQIILSLPEGRIVIDGQELAIGWVDREDVLVTGQVSGVRFEGERVR